MHFFSLADIGTQQLPAPLLLQPHRWLHVDFLTAADASSSCLFLIADVTVPPRTLKGADYLHQCKILSSVCFHQLNYYGHTNKNAVFFSSWADNLNVNLSCIKFCCLSDYLTCVYLCEGVILQRSSNSKNKVLFLFSFLFPIDAMPTQTKAKLNFWWVVLISWVIKWWDIKVSKKFN